MTMCIDNEALSVLSLFRQSYVTDPNPSYEITVRTLGNKAPEFTDLNVVSNRVVMASLRSVTTASSSYRR